MSGDKCILCGSSEHEVILSGGDRLRNSQESFEAVKCDECGLIFTLPYVSEESIRNYYPAEYYSIRCKVSSGRACGFEAWFSDHYSRILWWRLVERGEGFLPFIRYLFIELLTLPLYRYKNRCFPYRGRPGRMLDIGCGSGKLLCEERRLGWEVKGAELDPKMSSYSRDKEGLDVATGNFLDIDYEDNSFDVIVMNHVFEHFLDPMAVLKKIHDSLSPGGIVAMRVPDQSGFEKAVFGKRWHAYDLPRHRFHFSGSSIRKVLLNAGLKPLSVLPILGINNIILSMRYLLEDMKMPQRVTKFFSVDNKILRGILIPMGFVLKLLGQSSEMLVYAGKGK